jgi:hypothetical protein
LRGHKQADTSEEKEGQPPASIDEASTAVPGNAQAALPPGVKPEDSSLSAPAPSLEQRLESGVLTVRERAQDREDPRWPAAASAPAPHGVARSAAETALGLAALAAVSGRNWEERVDETLAKTQAGTLSKTARLARRLLRPARQRTQRTIHP